MNRYLYLAFFFIIVSFSTALGQQLSVKSFRALPNDMDARQNYKTIDQNGELCAIIKVVTSEKGFRFDIGSLGITKTEQQTGEIWLYVPHGARRVSIFHESLGVLRDYQFPEKIDEGVCYELVLVSGKTVTTVVANEIESQWLIITSEPTGADVFINDEPAGVTPYQNLLPVGKYNYRLQKTLYLNSAGVVELVSGGQKQKINAKLEPNFGTIDVTSSPERGASVLLDGVETGKTTPCTFERLPVGEHTLTVSLEMYATATQKVAVKAGLPQTVNIVMRPAFAEVAVKSTPKGDIYINNTLKGTGEWKGRLIPGLYNFEARLDKHISATEQRTVVIGQPLDLTLQPIPRTGSLNVMSNPIEATIRISGMDYGTTPNTIKNLLIGDYTVELSLPGYATAFEKVSITEGATSAINATLQTGREIAISSTPVGVDLYVDDRWVGTTPYKGSLTFGTHKLSISKEDKKSEKQVNIAQAGGESSFILSFGPEPIKETVNGVSFDMVAIEGGSFMMGSNDGEAEEKPIHRVTVNDFYMGKTEVTQALWKAVMGNNPSYFKGDNLPVEQVSWNDVQEFIKKLNRLTGKKYRLPTEAEWEYAAGGGSTNRTKWAGTEVEYSVVNYAWYDSNSGSQTQEVITKFPNSLGLYDMSGNVWEWCNDWYGRYSSNDQVNPTGASSSSFRVIRGGGWSGNLPYCRVAYRKGYLPVIHSNGIGFRLSLVP
jgi:formylglycine-generating enzyme required for sulfatase activity